MSLIPIFLTLQDKKQLTHDVFELEYSCVDSLEILPGQFLLCDTAGDPKLRRSYSVSWAERDRVFFIIKRLIDGKGGSVAICDQEIGHEMQVWGPMGRFILQENDNPKVFIGTGTGFAPLYYMIKSSLKKMTNDEGRMTNEGIFFLFGVRELRDVFYQEELRKWTEESSFGYQVYCSRETSVLPEKHYQGRVTDFFTSFLKEERDTGKNKEDFLKNKSSVSPIASQLLQKGAHTEFYICGSPAMVTEVRSMLELYGVSKEKVFFEQY